MISNVTIAPHHQKKGYGTLLHFFLAQYLRDEGFKKLTSDIVGMNTGGELAIWKKLQAGWSIEKQEPMSHLCVPRMLHTMEIIDDQMYKALNKGFSSHFGDGVYTLGKIEKTDFPQYEWDLSDPILMLEQKEAAA